MQRFRTYTNWEEVPCVMTLQEAANLVREGCESLKIKARKGQFPAYKQGKFWRVEKERLQKYMANNLVVL